MQKPSIPAVDSSSIEHTDLLRRIFVAQRGLMEKYHELEEVNGSPVIYSEDEGDLDNRKVQARIHELFGYMVREMAEGMQELKLKPWKRTEIPTDVPAFISEIGDVFHFFVEICITAGISADDLAKAYFREHVKNHARVGGDY